MKELKNYNTSIEIDGDLIFVTVAKYKLFLSYGKIGLDAYVLYSHLMFTARLQKTNTVKAKDNYLKNGLEWGSERLIKAKKLLYKLGLLKKIQRFKENGQFSESFLEIKTKTTFFENEVLEKDIEKDIEIDTATLETGTRQTRSAVTNNKCLNKEYKCLNEKENIYIDFFKTWNDKKIYIHKNINTFKNNFSKTKLKQLLTEYSTDEILKAIDNYQTIVSDPNYYFKHKWTLWDFLKRGIHKFVDQSNPFEVFKINYIKQQSFYELDEQNKIEMQKKLKEILKK